MKIPFFRLKLTSAERKSVLDVIKSGWVTTGPKVHEFEERIKKIAGSRYATAVSSCTEGLHLTLKALSIGRGDEVITTPFTMAATIEAIIRCGAKPVLADISAMTLNIDPESVTKNITKKTKVIISVDIAGQPCQYDKLKKIAKKYRLYLIDDAAHSFGATYKKMPIGSIADATVFSFYSTKNITTGEGGMVVTNSKRLADKVRLLSNHAMTSSGWKRYSGGGWRYDITDLGYKCNMSDLSAALGLGQLKRFKALQKKRIALANRYLKGLESLDEYIELPYNDKNSVRAWHLFIIKLNLPKLTIGRDRFIEELEKNGVGCGVHYMPVYHFSYYKRLLKIPDVETALHFTQDLQQGDFDLRNCEGCFNRVISLPFYPDLTFKEVDYVCRVLGRLVELYCK